MTSPHAAWRYEAMIGTGGIGSGAFLALDGDHTLGREESRSGRWLDRRDYCKLHIISHYVKVLLGPSFAVMPVGKVGADAWGRQLLDEMREAGLDLRYVGEAPGQRTLYSLCLIYPDGSGGNITTNDSACAQVDAAWIRQAAPELARYGKRGVVLAAPEVPLGARMELLGLGTEHGCWRVAAFTSAEMRQVVARGALGSVDLLAANLDEVAAALGRPAESSEAEALVQLAIDVLGSRGLWLSITAGQRGSWSWDGKHLAYLPALAVPAGGTTGAGDAHLAGMIAGLAAGLTLAEAHELAALTAAHSVTSPHTINKETCPAALRRLATENGAALSAQVIEFLQS